MSEPERAILGPHDPPPCRVVNPRGAAPFLVVCDHASRDIPQSLGRLGLDEAALATHIAWDIGAHRVAERLGERFDAPLVVCGFSRLVIDPNRRLDDPTSIPLVSDGVLIPGNRNLSPEEAARRAEELFRPYHAAISGVIEGFLQRGAVPALVSVHSFTPTFRGFHRPWHLGVLSNRDKRVARPLLEGLRRDPGLCVGDNQPYSAVSPVGYTMEAHAEAPGYPHALIEIRQNLLETPEDAARWAGRLGDALADILSDPDLYRVEHHGNDQRT